MVPGPFCLVKVEICKYVKPYYGAVSLLMVKSEFVIAVVNFTNQITIAQIKITISYTLKITITIASPDCN